MKWHKSYIGDVCLVGDGAHAKIQRQAEGILYLTCKNFKQGQLDLSKVDYISEEDYEKYFKKESKALTKPQVNDILFSIIGTLGERYIYKEQDYFGISSSVSILRPFLNKVYPLFLFYWIKSNTFQKALYGIKGGVAQGYVSLDMIRALPIHYPDDIAIQHKIADILSKYDDLIENNRRRIELLEESARLLYREWFVYLRFPGHEHTPIIDGIPEGWEKKQVKDILGKIYRPKKIQKSEYLQFGKIPCVDQSKEFIGGYTNDIDAVINDNLPIIVFGDHTRILKYINFPFACGADGTQLIVSNTKQLSQEYFYFALEAIDLSNYFYARHFKFLKDQYILIPSHSLVRQFTDSTKKIMEQTKILKNINIGLAKARDILIPRLMNGKIEV